MMPGSSAAAGGAARRDSFTRVDPGTSCAARRHIFRQYKAKYDAAEKAGKTREELWAILEDRFREERRVDEEVIYAETSYLYEMAYRLRITAPDHSNKELWNMTSYIGVRKTLTEKALTDFRAAIRQERNERWQYWELRLKVLGVLLTGLTGAIGTLIGLIAILKK
jgi:hypothetical protein